LVAEALEAAAAETALAFAAEVLMVRGRSLSCSETPVVETDLDLMLTVVGDVGDGRAGDGSPLVELFDAGLESFPAF
jgi:hypothetical protein